MSIRSIIKRESVKWVSKDIISEQQQKQILDSYFGFQKTDKKKSPINIVKILIVIATILLSVGIFLFYAANWKKMPPSAKLIQVFFLILATYGISYYQLGIKRTYLLLGRLFLIVGMITYGAGIILVAQIFHISSHPTNGVLAWAVGALIMAAVMREKWGYYLSMTLLSIWNIWEISEFNNPNYMFIFVPIVLGILYYREKDKFSMVLLFFLGFVVFVTVCFLINQLTHYFLNKKDMPLLFLF